MQERQTAIEAAQAAVAVIRASFGQPSQRSDKGLLDFATETDVEAERRIINVLTARFPSYGLLAEEAGWVQGGPDSLFSWLIDPLCGTLNFAAGLPLFNVNIALLERGKPVLGVLAEPLANTVLWAERGSGAHLLTAEGASTRVQAVLSNALVAYDFGHYPTEGDPQQMLRLIIRATMAPRFRLRSWSTSLGLGYLALGRFAAYVMDNTKPWDVAAGGFICQEAGCVVTDLDGTPWRPSSQGILAAVDGETHAAVQAYLTLHEGSDAMLQSPHR